MSGALALASASAFVVVCLGACLAPASAGQHACCEQGQGIDAPSIDCCKVVSGVFGASLAIVQPATMTVAYVVPPLGSMLAVATPHSSAARRPSPPLVLRI